MESDQTKHNTFFLDGLRGLAAMYVMIGHARMLLWEGFTEGYLKHPNEYSLVNKITVYFFSIFRYGHEAVLFFFVLSGFVIHLKYSKLIADSQFFKFSFNSYLKRRFMRIYPPFIFSIVFTFLLDWIGNIYFSNPYKGTSPSLLINSSVNNYHDLTTLIGNTIFLMQTYVPIWGTNGPSWSLKYEWWFYMIYPVFLFLNKKSMTIACLSILLLYTLSFFPFIWPIIILNQIFGYMLCWWFGVILADIYSQRIKISFVGLIPLCLLIPILILNNTSNNQINDTLWALGFMGALSCMFYLKKKGSSLIILEKFKILGDFSYTLYIIHFPILVLMCGIILRYNNNQLPQHLGYVSIGIILSLFLSYLLHFFIEKPFTKVSSKRIFPI